MTLCVCGFGGEVSAACWRDWLVAGGAAGDCPLPGVSELLTGNKGEAGTLATGERMVEGEFPSPPPAGNSPS